MTLRLFVSAGEASGDRHAAGLVRALRRRVPDLEVRGLGGPALEAEGAVLLARIDELAALGFSEVLGRLPFFIRLMSRAVAEIEAWQPQVVLPVDYPGFNLRLASRARARGFPVVYYIAPQVWAWRSERRPGIARAVDRLLVVFPFEEPLFREAGISTTFVGHPLLDAGPGISRESVRASLDVATGDRLLALLPGSRGQEVAAILPVLTRAAKRLPAGVRVVVSRAPAVSDPHYQSAVTEGLSLWTGSAGDLATAADAALVASGTATLEVGLRGTPMAVVYRTGFLNWHLARALIKIRTIGLVNIAAGGTRVPELLQSHLTPERVAETAARLLFDSREREEQRAYLSRLRERLGGEGAADRAADAVLESVELVRPAKEAG
jgi:lipid-A-disaccharide synthase